MRRVFWHEIVQERDEGIMFVGSGAGVWSNKPAFWWAVLKERKEIAKLCVLLGTEFHYDRGLDDLESDGAYRCGVQGGQQLDQVLQPARCAPVASMQIFR